METLNNNNSGHTNILLRLSGTKRTAKIAIVITMRYRFFMVILFLFILMSFKTLLLQTTSYLWAFVLYVIRVKEKNVVFFLTFFNMLEDNCNGSGIFMVMALVFMAL